MTNRDLIIAELRNRANLDGDELAKRIGKARQTVNQECNLLSRRGEIVRKPGGLRGKLVNRLIDPDVTSVSSPRTDQFRSIPSQRSKKMSTVPSGASVDMEIEGYAFERVLGIKPLRSFDGTIQSVMPQTRYRNKDNLSLHNYGQGPFCKFKVPAALQQAGVYAISVDGCVKYIGECENLTVRFNMGYGNISPRNCFDGGQQTNCRINALVYQSSVKGQEIDLWFHGTKSFKQVEQVLRDSLKLEWNRV